MPTNKNKKKQKGKEKNAAAAVMVKNPFCLHSPAPCKKCIMAFPPGCLHTIRQDERNSPEMIEIIRVFHASACHLESSQEGQFWEMPENAPFVTVQMLRFHLHMIIKAILGKDSFEDVNIIGHYKGHVYANSFMMFVFYGILKCGSEVEFRRAFSEDATSDSLNESQVSYKALWEVLEDMGNNDCNDYHHLVYILNVLSPCDCLAPEVERAREEAKQQLRNEGQQEDYFLLDCCNQCGEKEDLNNCCCAGCQLTVYCSPHCQKEHWKDRTTDRVPHKIACRAIQELKSLFAGGGNAGAFVSSSAPENAKKSSEQREMHT